ARDVAPEVHGASQPRQHFAANAVDGTREADRLEWPRAEIDFPTPQQRPGPQRLEVIGCCRLACDRDDRVTRAREHVDGDAADSTGGARNRDGSLGWLLVVTLHAMYRERRREARRA